MKLTHHRPWRRRRASERDEVDVVATLFPAYPHDVGVADTLPDVSRLEGAHLLANEARELLRADGFTDDEIDVWAETHLATHHTATLHDFLTWIAAQQQH